VVGCCTLVTAPSRLELHVATENEREKRKSQFENANCHLESNWLPLGWLLRENTVTTSISATTCMYSTTAVCIIPV
jgi:hypothetical protein